MPERTQLQRLIARRREDPKREQAYFDARLRSDVVCELRKIREEAGLSQSDVATAMSTQQSHVSEIENLMADPRLSTLQRYARAVGGNLRRIDIELDNGRCRRIDPRVELRGESEGTAIKTVVKLDSLSFAGLHGNSYGTEVESKFVPDDPAWAAIQG